MNFEILNNPRHHAIVKSILSREDASILSEIRQDVKISASLLIYNLRTLVDAEILERATHPTKQNKYNGRPLLVWYVSGKHEALQDVLRELFPEAFEEEVSA